MKAKVKILFFQNAKFNATHQITVRMRKTSWADQREYVLEAETYVESDPDWGDDPTTDTREILPEHIEISGAIGLPNHKRESKTFMRDEFAIRIAVARFDELYAAMASQFGIVEY